MADRLKDKVVIVTGAGSIGPGWGNGKAISVLYAREGARVFGVDINGAAAAETCALIEGEGGVCRTHVADVADAADVQALAEACLTEFGGIDVLVNNVGIAKVGGPVELDEADWDRVTDVNLKSVYLTCKHALPVMERPTQGRDRQYLIDRGAPLDRRTLRNLLRDQGRNAVAHPRHRAAICQGRYPRQLHPPRPDEHPDGACGALPAPMATKGMSTT